MIEVLLCELSVLDLSIRPENRLPYLNFSNDNSLGTFIYLFIFIIIIFCYFTLLYWFCHTSTCIHHGYTRVPHPEPPSHLPSHTIPLGHPSAPALSILYHASNLDWWFISQYMFQCHSPKSFHPCPLPESKRLFYTSVSLLLSHIQGYHYHLSKFHIYMLVYCIGIRQGLF